MCVGFGAQGSRWTKCKRRTGACSRRRRRPPAEGAEAPQARRSARSRPASAALPTSRPRRRSSRFEASAWAKARGSCSPSCAPRRRAQATKAVRRGHRRWGTRGWRRVAPGFRRGSFHQRSRARFATPAGAPRFRGVTRRALSGPGHLRPLQQQEQKKLLLHFFSGPAAPQEAAVRKKAQEAVGADPERQDYSGNCGMDDDNAASATGAARGCGRLANLVAGGVRLLWQWSNDLR